MNVVGLFAGIGGLEVGLAKAGYTTTLLCEIDPLARRVLDTRFGNTELTADVRKLRSLPADTDIVTAGFPCQDLSQAGRTAGITGSRSGLVDQVFRLIKRRRGPRWLVLENVPFMLQLDRGKAMHHLTTELSEMGYRWAYRVVDARAFGLPQRRHRVVLVASRDADPRTALFDHAATPPTELRTGTDPCGFYWTEGRGGLGWAINAVPTIKAGSSIGIASPPAVWLPGEGVVMLGINGAERLQGFDADWTASAVEAGSRPGYRWRLVGNAVSTRMSTWVGERLADPQSWGAAYDATQDRPVTGSWPLAAWGDTSGSYAPQGMTMWPQLTPTDPILDYLDDATPLSARASAGFLKRAAAGSLRFEPGFIDGVQAHLETMTAGARLERSA